MAFLAFFSAIRYMLELYAVDLKHGGFLIHIIQADAVFQSPCKVRISSVTVVKVPSPFNM